MKTENDIQEAIEKEIIKRIDIFEQLLQNHVVPLEKFDQTSEVFRTSFRAGAIFGMSLMYEDLEEILEKMLEKVKSEKEK